MMKAMRNSTCAILLFTCAFAFASMRAYATSSYYWAAVETTAYTGDKSGGVNIAGYSIYYCTLSQAGSIGGTSLASIEAYLAGSEANFKAAKAMATTWDSVTYSDSEYHILDYVSSAFASSDYVAIAFYGDSAYRVYGVGSATLTPNGQLLFNETTAAADTVGDWHEAVPEPTSGLLLLLGLSGLALKRKHWSVV